MVARWLRSGFAEDAVQVGATDGALGLGHPGALVVDVDLAAGLAVGLALHAVELAAPGFRHDGLLFVVGCRLDGELGSSVPPGRGGAPRWPRVTLRQAGTVRYSPQRVGADSRSEPG